MQIEVHSAWCFFFFWSIVDKSITATNSLWLMIGLERRYQHHHHDRPFTLAANGTYFAGTFHLMILPAGRVGAGAARLIVRVQVLEVENGAVLGLAIRSIELGGVIMTAMHLRLSQHRRRLVQVVAMAVTMAIMAMAMPIAVVCVRRNHRDGNALRLAVVAAVALGRQHFVAVARLQQRQIC